MVVNDCARYDPFEDCPTFPVLYSDGDDFPLMAGVLRDFDLTGHTLKLTIQRPTDVLEKVAAVVDAANGVFQFNWSDGDMVHGIGQIAVLQIIEDASGKSQSLARFKFDVRKVPPL